MQIALKGPNGLYVCAENGGGIDPRIAGEVAVRCNRPERREWETFELIVLNETQAALQTYNRHYVTAEGGGASFLRTDATSIGIWETLTVIPAAGLFRTWDGRHILSVRTDLEDPVVDATRVWTPPLAMEVLKPPPPPVNIKQFRGGYIIPNALPGIPYGDGQRIWTPAYGCYDEFWRAAIRRAYKDRGYTHFPYNCAGLPYSTYYPELRDDSARVARDLDELEQDGLVPVVVATDDRNPDVVLGSFRDNAHRIRVCFPLWEMNGVMKNDTSRMQRLIAAVRATAPDADCYLHFTPGHSAIGLPEWDAWKWCQQQGTVGLLAQGPNIISGTNPAFEGRGLETSAVRLAGLVGYQVPGTDDHVPPAWAGVNQRTVKFEWGVWEAFHQGLAESAMRAYTDAFMRPAQHVSGFCDGGS